MRLLVVAAFFGIGTLVPLTPLPNLLLEYPAQPITYTYYVQLK